MTEPFFLLIALSVILAASMLSCAASWEVFMDSDHLPTRARFCLRALMFSMFIASFVAAILSLGGVISLLNHGAL